MIAILNNEIICTRRAFPQHPLFHAALTYKLIRTIDQYAGDGFTDVYSMLVTMESGDEPESAFIYDISRDRERAEELLELLFAGEVTPCTAEDIICDLI